MKTTKKWYGIDASNEISLFEYGLIVRNMKNDLQCIYKKGDSFFYGWFDASDFFTESWVNLDDLCSFSGCTIEDYKKDSLNFCFDLLQYYGAENVFGGTYMNGYTEKEIRKTLNKALRY